jgi:hypothetical protein
MMPAICEQRSTEVLAGYFHSVDPLIVTARRPRTFERRGEQRLKDSLPARIWGIDINGEVLGLDCRMKNISGSGVYLSVSQRLRQYSDISLTVQLLDGSGMYAAIRGKVLRDDPEPGGNRGVAVTITDHRLL